VSATRRIAAPAHAIYAIVSSPSGHVEFDGSGMLVSTGDDAPTKVGDTFEMHMDRRPLGDIANLIEYDVLNTVTRIEPNRRFEWAIGSASRKFGHVYGWQLDPVGDDETDVTNYCDWTDVPEELLAARAWPVVPVEMLEQSVAKLEQLVAQA
jgi:hypothetical protein